VVHSLHIDWIFELGGSEGIRRSA